MGDLTYESTADSVSLFAVTFAVFVLFWSLDGKFSFLAFLFLFLLLLLLFAEFGLEDLGTLSETDAVNADRGKLFVFL